MRAEKPIAVIFVGHSHLGAVQRAHATHPFPLPVAFHQFRGPLTEPVRQAIAANPQAALVSYLAGNDHNVLGLVRHATPFDFIEPNDPHAPPEIGARLIPYGLMRTIMRRQIGPALAVLAELRAAHPGRFAHQSPPPPLPRALVEANHGVFYKVIPRYGVAPDALRLKIWRLQAAVLAECCRDLGVALLPVPHAAIGPDGMMASIGFLDDPTHASPWYGAQILSNVAAALA